MLKEGEFLASGGLIPRTRRPVSAVERNGTTRIAVIGQGEAEGAAAAFAALLSTEEGIEIVDRDQISQILTERSIETSAKNFNSRLVEIGDLLLADFIITASSIGTRNERLLRFETHSVATGLPIHRALYAAKSFKPEASAREYLEELLAKSGPSSPDHQSIAVSLLGVTPERSLRNGSIISGTINAGLFQEIDDTPGLIAVTRDQLAPIVQEQALGADGALWSSAWILEGGIRDAGEPSMLTLALRVTPATGGDPRDITVNGNSADLHGLVAKAWRALREIMDFSEQSASADPKRRLREAARLAREADWLMSTPYARQAAPLADAAFYLGGATPEAWSRRINAHWFNSPIPLNPQTRWRKTAPSIGQPLGYPLAPDVADYYASEIESQFKMLRLTSEATTHLRHFDSLMRLTAYRCWLTPEHMTGEQKRLLSEFDDELLQLWKIMLDSRPDGKPASSVSEALTELQRITFDYRKLPLIVDMVVERFYQRPYINLLTPGNPPPPVLQEARMILNIPAQQCLASLADVLERGLKNDSPDANLRRAEFAYLRGENNRAAESRNLARAWAETLSITGTLPRPMFTRSRLVQGKCDFPLHGFGGSNVERPFDMPLPAMVAAPRYCPDVLFRYEYYLRTAASYHHVNHSQTNRKIEVRNARIAHAQGIMRLLEKKSAGTEEYELFLHGLSKIDTMYGSDTVSKIKPLIQKNEQPIQARTFGASGKFRYLLNNDAIPAELLADLTKPCGMKGAFVSRFQTDPIQQDLLWAVVNPYRNSKLFMHQEDAQRNYDMNDPLLIHFAQPYLIAVDCNAGKIVHQINLPKAIFGDKADPSKEDLSRMCRFSGPMVFNDRQAAFTFSWPVGINQKGRANWQNRLVILDPKRGEIAALLETGKVETMRDTIGLDDRFYFLEKHWPTGKSLFCITPDNRMQALSQYGRRPNQSPFDEAGQGPTGISNDRGRLLVWASGGNRYYDPSDGTWGEPLPPRDWYAYSVSLRELERDSGLERHLSFTPEGFSAGKFTTSEDSAPGVLIYRTKETSRRIPVATPIDTEYPTTFMITPGITPQVRDLPKFIKENPHEGVSLADLVRSDMVHPVVVHQTVDSFILGLVLRIPRSFIGASDFTSGATPHLPFLWRVSKADVMRELE